MDLVSICIPTYNGAEFLDECLRCAVAQTHPNLEILIVDDSSSDDTLQIARAYASRDARIAVHRNEKNLGLVGNWNRCIELASGTWIKFLFQDDLLHPECVEKLLAEGQAQGALIVGCDRDFIFDNGVPSDLRLAYLRNRKSINDFLAPNRGATAQRFAAMIATNVRYNFLGEPTVALIHRRAFLNFGVFRQELAQICDLEFWARVAGQSGVAYVPEVLATFRAHASGTSALNRRGKSFRASGLDPVVMTSLMLGDPAYEVLRRHWRDAGVLNAVQQQAKNFANQVYAYVRRHGGDPVGDSTVAAEYGRFLQQYPGMQVTRAAHWQWLVRALPSRIRYQLGQSLSPFLPRKMRREKALPF
jgi:GT2 family glycosyltransferase